MGASFLLLLVGVIAQSFGGRQLTVLALLIEIAAAVVLVVGTYRHQEPPRQ
jgi:nitrate/nitrite transporter NarK